MPETAMPRIEILNWTLENCHPTLGVILVHDNTGTH
jgi:hypothetical protein